MILHIMEPHLLIQISGHDREVSRDAVYSTSLDIAAEVERAGTPAYKRLERGVIGHAWIPPTTELLVALGSAGVFTALYKIIVVFLKRHDSHEVTLQRGDMKVTIKAHNIPKELEILEKLLPEFGADRERKEGKKE